MARASIRGLLITLVVLAVCGLGPVPPAGALERLINRSFETGDFTGWFTHSLPNEPNLRVRTGGNPGFGFFTATPTHGTHLASHSFDSVSTGVIKVAQDVVLPEGSATLTFDYRAAWDFSLGNTATQPRTFDVNIEPFGGGATLESIPIFSTGLPPPIRNLDTGVLQATLDLSHYGGRAIRVNLDATIPQPRTGPGHFLIDNVSVDATPGPPSPPPSGIADPTTVVAGKTIGQLTQDWWNRTYSLPTGQDPYTDNTGADANLAQSGDVFMVGNFRGEPTPIRQYTVPHGMHLLLPLYAGLYTRSDPANETRAFVRGVVTDDIDMVHSLHLSINGQPVDEATLFAQRHATGHFPVVVAAGANTNEPAGRHVASYGDGFWVMLEPPRPGLYEIIFGGKHPSGVVSVHDMITVLPEPGGLAVTVFGALCVLSRRTSRRLTASHRESPRLEALGDGMRL